MLQSDALAPLRLARSFPPGIRRRQTSYWAVVFALTHGFDKHGEIFCHGVGTHGRSDRAQREGFLALLELGDHLVGEDPHGIHHDVARDR